MTALRTARGAISEPRADRILTAAPRQDGSEGVVLIKRRNDPPGWAIPGGFVEFGECAEETAAREIQEETGLALTDLALFEVRSDPGRDPRHHTVSVVYTARGVGTSRAGDDAADIGVFGADDLPDQIAFDHRSLLEHYWHGGPGSPIEGRT